MQAWEAITARRNVRSFADRPILAADLDQILEAGRSPSSQNWQPWDFILVTDRAQLTELAKVWVGAGHVAYSAATVVIVGPATDNEARYAPARPSVNGCALARFGIAWICLRPGRLPFLLPRGDRRVGICQRHEDRRACPRQAGRRRRRARPPR